MNAIETHNLTKIYGNKVIAVNGVDLAVAQGSVFGPIGPNGAGKTTIIKLMLGLQLPTAGTVRVFDQPMTPSAAKAPKARPLVWTVTLASRICPSDTDVLGVRPV